MLNDHVERERSAVRVSVRKRLDPAERGKIAIPEIDLEHVHDRHYLTRFSASSRSKRTTTYIHPEMEFVVESDRQAINNGQATWDQGTSTWQIHDRVYGDKGDGTFYPISGEGFTSVSKTANAIMNVLRRNGGATQQALFEIDMMDATRPIDPRDREIAMTLWRLRQKGIPDG